MTGFIYKITNKVNGKVYIGQTKYTIEARWKQHQYKKDKTHFHNAIRKYGVENFIVEQLEECEISELDSKEIYYIAKYNSFKEGYNSTIGGDGNKYLVLDDKYDEIKCLYLSGFSSNKIATLFNVDKSTIVKILKQLNVKLRSNKLNINHQEFLEIKTRYESGTSLKELAKEYGCSAPAMKEFLKRKGVEIKEVYSIWNYPDKQRELIQDYTESTLTLHEIFVKYKVSYQTLLKVLYKNNIPKGKYNSICSMTQREEMKSLYNKGIQIQEIAKQYNCSRQYVSKVIHGKFDK